MEIRVIAPGAFPRLLYVIELLNAHPITKEYEVQFLLEVDSTLEKQYRVHGPKEAFIMHCDLRIFDWQPSLESDYHYQKIAIAGAEFVGLVQNRGAIQGGEDFLPVDLFATHFFACSRVEEYAFPRESLDSWGLMPEKLHLAVRDGVHHMPFLDLNLKELFQLLGVYRDSVENGFEISVSYDFDVHQKFSSPREFLRTLARLVIKNPMALIPYTVDMIKSILLCRDPYDVRRMPLSDGTPCFLIVGGKHPFDPPILEKSRLQTIISELESNGCVIGFHPSYLASVVPSLFEVELAILQGLCSGKITKSRSHFLHQDPRITHVLFEAADLKEDWTMGFNTEIGFRAGTCYPYHSFDLSNDGIRDLLIVPFSMMDSAVWYAANRSIQIANKVIRTHMEQMEKWGLPVRLVLHNSIQVEHTWLGIHYPKSKGQHT